MADAMIRLTLPNGLKRDRRAGVPVEQPEKEWGFTSKSWAEDEGEEDGWNDEEDEDEWDEEEDDWDEDEDEDEEDGWEEEEWEEEEE